MSLILSGNNPNNIYTADSTISRTGHTKFSYFAKFTYTDGPLEVVFFNMGFEARIYRDASSQIRVRMRTDTDNIFIDAITSPVEGVEYSVLVTMDCGTGEGKILVDNVQVGTTTVLTGTEVRGTAFSTTIEGSTADGEDFKLTEIAQWLDIVPSSTGTSLVDFTPAPTHSYEPVGDGSTYLPTMLDTSGSLDLSHTQGPTTGGNEPVADGEVLETLVGLFTPESGANLCSIGNPVAGVPMQPTLSAVGVTIEQIQMKGE